MTAQKKWKGELTGTGCLIQGIALILLFFFPIGTIIAVPVFIAGSIKSRVLKCSNCGTKLAGRFVKTCPGCNADLI